jgi:polysaccharide export outer membrane protein
MNHLPKARRVAHWLLTLASLALLAGGLSSCSYKNKPVLFKTPQKVDQQGKPLVVVGSSADSTAIRKAASLKHQSDSLNAVVSKLRNEAVGKPPTEAADMYARADEAAKLAQQFDADAKTVIRQADSLANMTYMHRIKPDDMVSLRFLNNFDVTEGVSITNGQSEISFLVDREGFVYLPMLGKVKLGGMTRSEASRHLEQLYAKDFKNPSIEVYISNLYVTIMGAVKSEGNFPIVKEHTTLVEALALAGGLNELSKKKQVKVIRNTGPGRPPLVLFFDLTQLSVLEEEQLIVHDKDIIYVEPVGVKVFSDRATPFLTLGSFATSTIAITVTLLTIFRTPN